MDKLVQYSVNEYFTIYWVMADFAQKQAASTVTRYVEFYNNLVEDMLTTLRSR